MGGPGRVLGVPGGGPGGPWGRGPGVPGRPGAGVRGPGRPGAGRGAPGASGGAKKGPWVGAQGAKKGGFWGFFAYPVREPPDHGVQAGKVPNPEKWSKMAQNRKDALYLVMIKRPKPG